MLLNIKNIKQHIVYEQIHVFLNFAYLWPKHLRKKNLQEETSVLAQDSVEIKTLWWERNTMEYTGNKAVHCIVDQKQWKRKTWL